MDHFNNKYRISSARLQSWDYGKAGFYFITICTHDRAHFFGKITKGKMQLSDLGRIAEREWLKTFELRPDMNLFMGEFVVMPNHFHAIIGIGENEYNMKRESGDGDGNGNGNGNGDCRDAMHCVSTVVVNPIGVVNPIATVDPTNIPITSKNQFGPQSKNLASIIRGFKSSVTVAARQINPDFQWQPRFHDHIIRNEGEFERISQYIINNPEKWDNDQFKNRDVMHCVSAGITAASLRE
ncbi:transposase [Chryseobacterium salivictor]|uniref:Transposase IS200-like domain-containing protein n=1 Tax=Chryseobacterium salivictor TaxID=2547600 RepID=A0A4P6ZHC9_9FLAO|nr:transposase [Chryseobacterium salivictor]QBO59170.1 hypothetical protein NBC122_02366 [Chryseobacterium salivictor]